MNLQGTVNQTIGTVGQSIGVVKMLGTDKRAGLEAQEDINNADDKLFNNRIKESRVYASYSRANTGKWLEAMQKVQDEKQTLLDQKNKIIASYQTLYHGVSDNGNIDLTKFRKRLIPKKTVPKIEIVPTAEEMLRERRKKTDASSDEPEGGAL